MIKITSTILKMIGFIFGVFTFIGVFGLIGSLTYSKAVLHMKINGYGFTSETTAGYIGCLFLTIGFCGLTKIFYTHLPKLLIKKYNPQTQVI